MAALVSGQWRTTFSDHVDDDGGDGFIGVVLASLPTPIDANN